MKRLEDFDTWIRKGHGRCQSCGFHPATQGHGDGCRDKIDDKPRGERCNPPATPSKPPRSNSSTA